MEISKENRSLINSYLDMISKQKRYSKHTSVNYQKSLFDWANWLCENEFFKGDIGNVGKNLAKNYVVFLMGKYNRVSLRNKVSAISSFYKYLICIKSSLDNPFSGIRLPKLDKNLPVFMTEKQVPRLIDAPEILLSKNQIDEFDAFRDKVILEFLYGTGLRVSELCALKWSDLDMEKCYAKVLGKGQKERICPFTYVARDLLNLLNKNYRVENAKTDFVFTLKDGSAIYPRLVQRNLKKYLLVANLPMNITPHKIRHSYATSLVNDGMDLRVLQELLGHSSLSTTQIYTHLSMKKIQSEYRKAHPHS